MNISDLPSKWRKVLGIMERSSIKNLTDFVYEIKFHIMPLLSLMSEGWGQDQDNLVLDLKQFDNFKKESLIFEDREGQQRICYAVRNKLLGNSPLILKELKLEPSKNIGHFYTSEDGLQKTYNFDFKNEEVSNFRKGEVKGSTVSDVKSLR